MILNSKIVILFVSETYWNLLFWSKRSWINLDRER